jgi:glycine betaine transporter
MKKDHVFVISILLVLLFGCVGILTPVQLEKVTSSVHAGIIHSFGWFYHLAAFFFLGFCFFLAFGRFGQIRLGKDTDQPEYTYFGWFSMLFAAGMGIGLVFWGVAEPLSHFLSPPEHISPGSGSAAAFAMRYSFFHWGLQPWAIYIVMSLSLAYFIYRRDLPSLVSSCFHPLFGERIHKLPGHLINIMAVFATVFGVATSLGFGALQIGSGLNLLYGIPTSFLVTTLIIVVVTFFYMASSLIGLDKGIQTLSKFNMYLVFLLMAVMLIVGPTAYILNVFISTTGSYLFNLVEMSLQTFPFRGLDWAETWTLFYWAWWIAWSPFVGLFIARISKGRTIKEFVLGTLFAPTLLTLLWFGIFGGTGLYLELEAGANFAEKAIADVSTTLYLMFNHLPIGSFLSLTALILLFIFFITSADSATFVLGMMTSKGDLNPPALKKIAWGATQSFLAIALLFTGGLTALQQTAIAVALPFTVIMVLMCYALLKALGEEKPGQ